MLCVTAGGGDWGVPARQKGEAGAALVQGRVPCRSQYLTLCSHCHNLFTLHVRLLSQKQNKDIAAKAAMQNTNRMTISLIFCDKGVFTSKWFLFMS